ncbi:MAG: hypothetical protein FD178_3176 [Ignavibacteria bacterium]|nr:MAG: hypothetical protein FD178_3176 [Ignavibacteria bacterium]
MIKEFEFYHGVVFTKLIHGSESYLSIKPYPTEGNASYIINENTGIYIKHSARRMSPWQFSFHKDHQNEILQMKSNLEHVFLVLVCGEDGIVTLNYNELKILLDDIHGEMEWIRAARSRNQEYTVNGSDGGLVRKIGKSDFPKKVLAVLR